MKYSNILKFAIAALLPVMAGCSDSIIDPLLKPYGSDGDTVTVDFGLDFDEGSSNSKLSRADDPDENTATTSTGVDSSEEFVPSESTPIYIVAFDENNLLTDVYPCKYTGSAYVKSCGKYHHHFEVTLYKTSKRRNIHIIANYDLDTKNLPYATESDLFNSKYMMTDKRVYWRRIELPNGIDEKITTYLNGVKLIRNFARVNLTFELTDDSKYKRDEFSEIKWCMLNVPTKSFVAPYLKGQEFATFLKLGYDKDGNIIQSTGGSNHNDAIPCTYDDLYEEGYRCNVPRTQDNASSFYSMTSASEITDNSWSDVSEPLYVFENEGSSDSQYFKRTSFLIKAVKDGKPWYYRLNLVDPDRNYEQLYLMRNVSYEVKVTAINDEGFSSPAEAFSKAAANNISSASSTSTFTNVSANNAALRVEYMTKYIFSNDTISMKYRYVPDITNIVGNSYVADNDKVTLTTAEAYTGTAPAIIGTDNTKYAINKYERDTEDVGNYRKYTLKPNLPQKNGVETISKIRVQVNEPQYTDKENTKENQYYKNNILYRDVTFVLRQRFSLSDMEITKDDSPTNTYTLTVKIPAGLPEAIFPLDFTFETYPPFAYPNADKSIMRVTGTDESLFSHGSYDTFHYHRAVTYENYSLAYDPSNSQTFKEENGYRLITFYFQIIPENLPTDDSGHPIVFFAVYEKQFSADPKEQLERIRPWPLFAAYKFEETSSGSGDYKLTKEAEYKTEEDAYNAWYALHEVTEYTSWSSENDSGKPLSDESTEGSTDNSSSSARHRSAGKFVFDPKVSAKNPQRIARLRAAIRK
jgi:hypothetical protein